MTYLVELTAPRNVDGEPNWIVHELVAIARASSMRIVGNENQAPTAAELVKELTPRQFVRRIRIVAFDGEPPREVEVGDLGLPCVPVDAEWPRGQLLGAVVADVSLVDNLTLLDGVALALPPDAGDVIPVLLGEVDRLAAHFGRDTILGYSWHGIDANVEQIQAASGLGSVPVDQESQAYLNAGYALTQQERNSRLDVPLAEDRLAACEARVHADYVVDMSLAPIAAADRGAMCHLLGRLDADSPSEGVDHDISVWSDERLREWESRRFSDLQTTILALGRDKASGQVVAYSELIIPLSSPVVAFQGGTLVDPEHRGHGLGWGVKAAALRELTSRFPQCTYVSTWNVEENPWMLAINEFLGFRPASVAGVWRKTPV